MGTQKLELQADLSWRNRESNLQNPHTASLAALCSCETFSVCVISFNLHFPGEECEQRRLEGSPKIILLLPCNLAVECKIYVSQILVLPAGF